MKIKVHANSSQEKLTKINEEEYEIWIKEKPIEGKANYYLEKFLKREFGKPVKIVKGFKSKIKVFEFA
ncbi:MAG: DUF167 domain-containing protein [Nanoarchaeota archaeon]|nr:DUF167 domain-containing protein [Nanoarchaeota archaeon]